MITLLLGLAGVAIVVAIGCWAILHKQKKGEEIVFEPQKVRPPKIKKAKTPKKVITESRYRKGGVNPPPIAPKPKIRPVGQNVVRKSTRKPLELPASLYTPVVQKQEEVSKKSVDKKDKKARKSLAKEIKKDKAQKQHQAVKKVRQMLDEKRAQEKAKKRELKKIKPISKMKVPTVKTMTTKRPIPKQVKKPVVQKPISVKKKDSYIELIQTLVGWRYRIKKHGVKDAAISEPYPTKPAIMKIVVPLAKDLGVEIREPKQIGK